MYKVPEPNGFGTKVYIYIVNQLYFKEIQSDFGINIIMA